MIKEKGFTLIELVIVIGIIGLITSVVTPSFKRIQIKAKETTVKMIGNGLRLGVESHLLITGDYPEGDDLGIVDLVSILSEEGSYNQYPQNPFTGQIYTNEDTSGMIIYRYSALGDYELVMYGKNNENIIDTITNS